MQRVGARIDHLVVWGKRSLSMFRVIARDEQQLELIHRSFITFEQVAETRAIHQAEPSLQSNEFQSETAIVSDIESSSGSTAITPNVNTNLELDTLLDAFLESTSETVIDPMEPYAVPTVTDWNHDQQLETDVDSLLETFLRPTLATDLGLDLQPYLDSLFTPMFSPS